MNNPTQAPVIELTNVTKRYKDLRAVDGVTLRIDGGKICGLLGRNGAGKTTLMSILTAQDPETSGVVLVFGEHPYENDGVLSRMCFIRESQKYPEDFNAAQAFKAAAMFFANWDQQFADRLAEEFGLPLKRRIKKLSRGQLSAVGVVIGLASRAELTFFDEPYLGLDAVARQIFYDRLVEDYSRHPRTIILSSHLIDEVANLLEHVLLIDHGRIILDDAAENIRGSAATVTGADTKVAAFTAGRKVLHRERLGTLAAVTIEARLGSADRARAAELGLELAPVSLQQLVVRKTIAAPAGGADAGPRTATDQAEVEVAP